MEVLTQLALDKTNKEIAATLFLSTRTVDMHVRNLLQKLGCSSRGAAVRRAVDRGLVAVESWVRKYGNRRRKVRQFR
jgi:DNA-binding NarL/FixJ family response regulator